VTRRALVLTAGAAIVVAAVVSGSQQKDDPLDPVRVAPDTHKVAFEPRHRHPHGLSVYLTDWDTKSTIDGQPSQVARRKSGTFAWSDAVVHTVQNVGPTEGHVLRIELKR
jgi:hypothetical protein